MGGATSVDIQQILALICVSVAAVYLGRRAVQAARAFRKRPSGCGGGCGRCGLASLAERPGKYRNGETIIPLKPSDQQHA